MAFRVVVIGGGAAGIGAAGGGEGGGPGQPRWSSTPSTRTSAYSPCGIPYVHGKEIPTSSRCSSPTKQAYVDAGIDIHYDTVGHGIRHPAHRSSTSRARGTSPTTASSSPPASTTPTRASPAATSAASTTSRTSAGPWSGTRSSTVYEDGVVVEACPLGLEMVTALAHRGIETHLVDPHPWALAEAGRPRHRRAGRGVLGRDGREDALQHPARGVRRRTGELPGGPHLRRRAARRPGRSSAPTRSQRPARRGRRARDRLHRRDRRRRADGDVGARGVRRRRLLRGPARRHQRPAPGPDRAATPTPRARWRAPRPARRRAATRPYQPVYVPWGMVAGKWMIGGVSFGETTAPALGIPYVLGVAAGISRARYYPDVKPVRVKLLAEPGTLRLIGAQMVGGEGIKERADFLAMAVHDGHHAGRPRHDGERLLAADRRAQRADRRSPPRTAWPRRGAAEVSASRWLRANTRAVPAARTPSGACRGRRRWPGPPAGSRRPDELFWRLVFVPVYRALPWTRPPPGRCT